MVTIFARSGNISIRSTNISQCIATDCSGYFLKPSTKASVSFCTVENTTCNPSAELLGHYDSKTYFVSFCTILKNKVSSTGYGIIYCAGIITIENCSIFGNDGPPGFEVFSRNGGTSITVKNCYVQSYPSIPSDITTDNIKYEEKYLNLSHLSTSKCEALIPIVNKDENKIINIEDDTFDPEYIKFIRSLVVSLSSANKSS